MPIGGTQQFTGDKFFRDDHLEQSIRQLERSIRRGLYHAPATFPLAQHVHGYGNIRDSTTASSTITVVFPNNNAWPQAAPIKLGSSGGNVNDVGTTVCCIGTLGSLWTRADLPNPVILSNNHVLA